MTDNERRDIFQFAQKFALDNSGHRLNEWLIEAFLNRLWEKLKTLDDLHQPHDAEV